MLIAGFASSRPDRFVWPDRKWEYATLRYENGDFELPTGIDLEARDRWFSQAVGMSPKMVLRTPGAGSLYWLGLRDKDGAYLDGGKTYRLSVPQPVPQKLFWSVTVYDRRYCPGAAALICWRAFPSVSVASCHSSTGVSIGFCFGS